MNENSYGTPIEDRNILQLAILVCQKIFMAASFFWELGTSPMISFLANAQRCRQNS